MDSNWTEFLSRQGVKDGGEHCGDLAGELAAARGGTVLAPLLDQGVIRVSGEDANDFLHNLLTNDIHHLDDGQARHAGLCTAKGRLLASFLVWREGPDHVLALSADLLAGILKKLSMYVLRSKVRLTDASAERLLLGLAGPRAEALLRELGAQPGAAMSVAPFAGGIALRLDERRFVLAVTAAAAQDAWTKLAAADARPAGLAAWRLLEIAAGQPRIVAATQESFVPQMVNYELPGVAGVSFQKGCYPGQEIVARTQYIGKIKRRMYRARLDQAFPPGTDIFTPEAGNQHCGSIVLTAPAPEGGWECLLVVQSSGVEAGKVHVGSPNGPTAAFLPLPYSLD